MDDSSKSLWTLLASTLLGVVAAVLTSYFKLGQQRDVERERDHEQLRLRILNPLLVAGEDLLDRIMDIRRRRGDAAKCRDMKRWFASVKDRITRDPGSLSYWSNDEGYFAMSTLYMTGVYFHYAATIRREFPFFELDRGGESTLLNNLAAVRTAIGGKFGIWEVMQDSLGVYLSTDTGVKSYRQFCEMLVNGADAVWLNRLCDCYRDIDLKLDDQLANVEQSLKELLSFLRRSLHVAAIQYCLTEESFAQLRERQVPPAMVDDLEAHVSRDYLDEVDFVAALVAAIGQDLTDDYKPSILRCSSRRLLQAA